jgi:hypothetical protein
MADSKLPRVQAILMQVDSASRRDDANLWIVPICPFCGKRHTHAGGRSATDAHAALGRHAAPCGQGAYNLVDIAQSGRSGLR